MSFVGSGTTGTEAAQKFLESLQNDFRNLSAETKKKNPQIKEVKKKRKKKIMSCMLSSLYENVLLMSSNSCFITKILYKHH